MPDDIDDFFAELDAVADQVQQRVSRAAPSAPVGGAMPASPPAADHVGSLVRPQGHSAAETPGSGSVAPAPAVESLDDFFGDASFGAASGGAATEHVETLDDFFGNHISTSESALSQDSGAKQAQPLTQPSQAADDAAPAVATSAAAPAATDDAESDTSPIMRHTLLCNLHLCHRPNSDGQLVSTGSGALLLGPGSWCKAVLHLNAPRQTIELQSWQIPLRTADGVDSPEISAMVETVLLSFWKGRAIPELEVILWFTPCDADNSIHPDDDGSAVAWHRGGSQVVVLERLPLFASTVVPLDDLSAVLQASASVSARPTDCSILPDPETKHSTRDEWGFSVELCNPAPPKTSARTESDSVGRHHRRSMQWQRALRRATQAEKSGADGAQQREYRKELRRICCIGVPSPHRGHAWYVLSGARDKALASATTKNTVTGDTTAGDTIGPSEFQAKLAEAREEIAWYANGGAARLRAKTRATVHGGARLCGVASGPVGTYTAALIRPDIVNAQPEITEQPSNISSFGMQLDSDGTVVVVSSVVSDSPADHAGVVVGDLALSMSADNTKNVVMFEGLDNSEDVRSALSAAHKLICDRHEGCVTYWHFRTSKQIAPPPSESPPYGSTYSSVHGTASGDDEDMVRRQGEEDSEALFVEKAINAAADLLMEASEYQSKHGGTLTDEAEEYSTVNSEAMRCLALRDIETDLRRTFPDHPAFHVDAANAGLIPSLRRVLLAYSKRNPSVGYCQGMNFVCAMMLLFMGEEEAYWLLSVICEDYFSESYTLDMAGASIDSVVLEEACASEGVSGTIPGESQVQRGCPTLAKRLQEMGVSVSLLSAQWFLCLYVDVFPTAAVVRTWDIMMLDGCGVIFAVALAAFQAASDRLLQTADDPYSDLHDVVNTLKMCNGMLTDVKPSTSGAGRSPIDWIFERADFASFHTAALARKRATVRFRLEQESISLAGPQSGARLQNRLERGARTLERQLSQVSVKEKLDDLEKSVDTTLGGLDRSLNTLENAVDTKLVHAADKIEERADEMLAKASKISKLVGGSAKGLFGRAKAAAADKMATLEQEWQQVAAEQEGKNEIGGAANPYSAGNNEMPRRETRHYVVVERAVVRSGWQLDSEKLGEMETGEELVVTESVTHPQTGVERVRFAFMGHDAWTSVTSTNGVLILQQV